MSQSVQSSDRNFIKTRRTDKKKSVIERKLTNSSNFRQLVKEIWERLTF